MKLRHTLLACVLALAPACIRDRAEGIVLDFDTVEVSESGAQDTVLTSISITSAGNGLVPQGIPVGRLDIFVYSDAPAPQLERYIRLPDGGNRVQIYCTPGPKTVAVVANAPGEFEIEALGHFDTLEEVVVTHDALGEGYVMSGIGSVEAGGEASIKLDPLACRIMVRSIMNSSDIRLENPRVFLMNANSSAQLFRDSGFRPVEQIDSTSAVPLPCDIGIFTQYPGTQLVCLPHDRPSPTAKEVHFVLEYERDGVTERWTCPCGPLKRNSSLVFDINVN